MQHFPPFFFFFFFFFFCFLSLSPSLPLSRSISRSYLSLSYRYLDIKNLIMCPLTIKWRSECLHNVVTKGCVCIIMCTSYVYAYTCKWRLHCQALSLLGHYVNTMFTFCIEFKLVMFALWLLEANHSLSSKIFTEITLYCQRASKCETNSEITLIRFSPPPLTHTQFIAT